MSDDDERIFRASYSDNHPANYDQQVETARDLLLRADMWVLLANEPLGDDKNLIHGMTAATPSVNLAGFIEQATRTFAEMVRDIFSEEVEDDEGEESP